MLEYEFQLKSFTVVFLPLSDTLQGPSSNKSPETELQPGPPFSHIVNGAFSGARRDSKNLQIMKSGQCMRLASRVHAASPEEKMFSFRDIQKPDVLLHGCITERLLRFCDAKRVPCKRAMLHKLICAPKSASPKLSVRPTHRMVLDRRNEHRRP